MKPLLFCYLWIGLTLALKGWWDTRHKLNRDNYLIHCVACVLATVFYTVVWPWALWKNWRAFPEDRK
jgi:hypothetical protein